MEQRGVRAVVGRACGEERAQVRGVSGRLPEQAPWGRRSPGRGLQGRERARRRRPGRGRGPQARRVRLVHGCVLSSCPFPALFIPVPLDQARS